MSLVKVNASSVLTFSELSPFNPSITTSMLYEAFWNVFHPFRIPLTAGIIRYAATAKTPPTTPRLPSPTSKSKAKPTIMDISDNQLGIICIVSIRNRLKLMIFNPLSNEDNDAWKA